MPVVEPQPRRKSWGLDDSIGYLARIAFRRFTGAFERRTAPFQISAGQYRLLRVLWDGDGLPQCALSDRLGACEPTVAVTARRLEHLGLVRRKVNPSNRRETLVYLTKRSRELEAQLKLASETVEEIATIGFSDEETAALLSLLRRVVGNLESADFAADRLSQPLPAGNDGTLIQSRRRLFLEQVGETTRL